MEAQKREGERKLKQQSDVKVRNGHLHDSCTLKKGDKMRDVNLSTNLPTECSQPLVQSPTEIAAVRNNTFDIVF